LGGQPSKQISGRLLRKWSWQIALNVALTAGVFIAAVYVRQNQSGWLENLRIPPPWLDAVMWAAALLVAMPLLIASYRKLQAVGMLIGEMAAKNVEDKATRHTVTGVLSTSIVISGAVAFGIVLLLLSAAILPSREILFAVVLVVGLVTALLWRSFVRIYSKAQITIQETLAQSPAIAPESSASLAGLLGKAELRSVTLGANSLATRRLIRELRLRTETGATIIGIERNGSTTVNPDPDEELLVGDRLLLLGRPEQLDKAETIVGEADLR
jgi:CPA2 family monovalent cation:H+ antiporter-2